MQKQVDYIIQKFKQRIDRFCLHYKLIIFLTPFFHVLDILSTYVFLQFGLKESNPLMASFFNHYGFFLPNVISFIGIFYYMIIFYKLMSNNPNFLAKTTFFIMNIIMWTIPISNSLITIKHLLS